MLPNVPTVRPRAAAITAASLAAVVAAIAVLPAGAAAKADPVDLQPYYSVFERGKTKIPGHDTRWVPQGLAYLPGDDDLAISYYDGDGKKNSRLAIIDRGSGIKRKIVVLPTKGHVGGLAARGKYLWVADKGKITRVLLSTIAAHPDISADPKDEPIKSAGSWDAPASSFMTISGNQLWVGRYEKDRNKTATTYGFSLSKSDVPNLNGATLTTPGQVQGMAIKGSNVIWSRSTGRDNRSTIEVRPLSNPAGSGRTITAPNMSEGLAIGAGRLHVVYESGSKEYSDADYKVRTVQSAPIGRIAP